MSLHRKEVQSDIPLNTGTDYTRSRAVFLHTTLIPETVPFQVRNLLFSPIARNEVLVIRSGQARRNIPRNESPSQPMPPPKLLNSQLGHRQTDQYLRFKRLDHLDLARLLVWDSFQALSTSLDVPAGRDVYADYG